MASGFAVAGRRVVVVGAARSGMAAARLLAERGARVVLTDTRPEVEDAADLESRGVEVERGGHRSETLARADLIVLSPGVPPGQPLFDEARRRGIPVIGELELASRFLEGRVVAITGTKGKSTTTTLVGRMLEAGGVDVQVGGNLGPAACLQAAHTGPGVVHVLEVSSFQLELIDTFRPDIAVFLNFTADHLDRHGSAEAYAEAKARLFRNQRPADVAIVNVDDPMVMDLAARTAARVVPISGARVPDGGAGVREGVIERDVGGARRALVPVSSVRLLGRHLLIDVVAAATVADQCGVGADAIRRAVAGFGGLEHALELVATIGGVRFVNDSKATNVEAARQAIESFDRGVVAILGGRFKGGDPSMLAGPLAARAGAAVLIGESRPRFREALADRVPVVEAASLEDAVREAWRLAAPGGVVLLAPACASFDMFRDYAERGRMFKDVVAALAGARQES